MTARSLTGIVMVPLFGLAGAAWAVRVLADAFLIPACFYVRKKLWL